MNALYHTLQENPSKCNRLTFKCNALHLFLHFNSIEHCRNLKYIPFICKTDRSIVFFYHFTNTLNTMPMSDIIFLGCFQAFIFLSCFAVCYYKKQNPRLVLQNAVPPAPCCRLLPHYPQDFHTIHLYPRDQAASAFEYE